MVSIIIVGKVFKMETLSEVLSIHSRINDKNIAKVRLNGYNISTERSLWQRGALRSFSINSGDLRKSWSRHEMLLLHDGKSRRARIKIAALPTDEDSFGLIEFL